MKILNAYPRLGEKGIIMKKLKKGDSVFVVQKTNIKEIKTFTDKVSKVGTKYLYTEKTTGLQFDKRTLLEKDYGYEYRIYLTESDYEKDVLFKERKYKLDMIFSSDYKNDTGIHISSLTFEQIQKICDIIGI